MRLFIFLTIGFGLVGCQPSGTTVAQAPSRKTSTNEIVVPHPLKEDPEYKLSEKIAKEQASKIAEPSKPTKSPDPKPSDSKIDPAVLGQYRLRFTAEQEAAMKSALEQIKIRADKGESGASAAYQQAQMAVEMSKKMTIELKRSGDFNSNFGEQNSTGKFLMFGSKVILKPSEKPKDSSLPQDIELTFDGSKKTLTVNYQGRFITLARVG